MYRTIFKSEFNISFLKPKKDLCKLCHRYDNSSVTEKSQLEEEYQLHLRNKNPGREKKNMDKEKALGSSMFCVATFDLQHSQI